jgi:hypothetical protein
LSRLRELEHGGKDKVRVEVLRAVEGLLEMLVAEYTESFEASSGIYCNLRTL